MDATCPLFVVNFRDLETANNLAESVIIALRNIESVGDVHLNPDNLQLKVFSGRNVEMPPPSSPSPTNTEGDPVLFIEDTQPADIKRIEIPAYEQKFDVLNTSNKLENSQSKEKSFGVSCFNCGQNHTLRDCTEQKNYARIEERRRETKTKPRFARYHVDDQNDDSNNIPGPLSRELRRALGLEKDQLPLHIYKMRVFGYPPGWLLHAKVTHSGLALFDSQGKEVKNSGDELEGAELKDEYDINKIISFPGFNVRPSSKYVDESKMLGFPPYSESHSKMKMMEQLAPLAAKAYRRRKMKRSASQVQSDDLQTYKDMDIDSDEHSELNGNGYALEGFAPPLPPDFPPPLPPPVDLPPPPPTDLPSLPSDESVNTTDISESKDFQKIEGTSRSDSPTLADLEAKKQNLIFALNEEESDISNVNDESQSSMDTGRITPKSNLDQSRGSISSSNFGTPVLSLTPYSKLPNPDEFSKDISDVIDFENLPDYTGKYQKICGVIKKIRETVEKLHELE